MPGAQHFTVLKMTASPWLRLFPRTDDVCFLRNLSLLRKLWLIYSSLSTFLVMGGALATWVTISIRGRGDVLVPGEKAASLN